FAGPETNWVPGMGARRMAEEAAVEIASSNGTIGSVQGDEDAAEVAVRWPDDRNLAGVGLTRSDIERFWVIWEPLAASVGLEVAIATLPDGTTRLRFTRPSVA